MSKMDGLRAMREAKYAEAAKRAAKPAGRPAAKTAAKTAGKQAPGQTAAPSTTVEPAAEAPTEQLCGHRNMSGRSCTREHGHAAKSHRYS